MNVSELNDRIDAAIRELITIDMEIVKATGKSVGFTELRDLKQGLKANAARIHGLSIEERAYNDVMNRSMKINEVARKYARSPSTIRRWLDKVQEAQR
jgi:DNA repair ATPase RecN